MNLMEKQPLNEPISNLPATTIGIDFGTTQSLVASRRNEHIELLADKKTGEVALLSTVWIGEEGCLIGKEALEKAEQHPNEIFSSVKRLLGRSEKELEKLCGKMPYSLTHLSDGSCELETGQGTIHPIEITAEILKTLKQRAQKALTAPIAGAVITVPAYFDEAQRECVKDAAQLAGIPLTRLLHEPTAAALAYLYQNPELEKKETLLAVYDFGGGTFDFSLLKLSYPFIEVLATQGDTLLGGDDIDSLLAKQLQKEWAETFPSVMLGENEIKRQWSKFLLEASRVKRALSQQTEVEASFGRWRIVVTRNTLEEMAEPFIQKSLNIMQEVFRRVAIRPEEVDQVLLVGGPTKLPFFKKYLTEFYGQEPDTSLDPEGAVAIGAAYYAELLNQRKHTFFQKKAQDVATLLDVTPLSFGLEVMGGKVEVFLPRNTPLPATIEKIMTNVSSKQREMPFHILQGESELVSECRSLAKFMLTDLPESEAGELKISVTFSVDVNGMLTVSAHEVSRNIQHTVSIKPTYKIPKELEEELARKHAKESEIHFDSEKEGAFLKELAQLIDYIESSDWVTRLENHQHKLSQEAPKQVREVLQNLKTMMANNDSKEEIIRKYREIKPVLRQFLLRY